MRKYIRTKDENIVDVSLMQEFETDDDNGKRIFDGYEDKDGTYYPVENIIAQANTLEELCDDYFAISNTDYKTPIKIDFEEKIIYQWQGNKLVVEYTFEQFIPYHTIYGAIWTEWGLKYVAKMNEKGELELL